MTCLGIFFAHASNLATFDSALQLSYDYDHIFFVPFPTTTPSFISSTAVMAFTYWPGACDITYTHSAEPLTLPTKSGPSRALPSLIEDSVPPCNLNPFLPNGHLQTFWTAMKFDGPPIHYKRRTFAASQDSFAGHFTVDFVTAAPPPASPERDAEGHIAHDAGLTEDPVGVGHNYLPPRTTYFSDAAFDALGADDDKPLLICLHGLSGGSYETYLRHVLAPLVAETPAGAKAGGLSGGEWEALVVNSRGCAGSKITNSMLYNARATWDVRQTVKWAREKWPRRRMFGVGFSLGANILTTVGTSPCSSKEACGSSFWFHSDLFLGQVLMLFLLCLSSISEKKATHVSSPQPSLFPTHGNSKSPRCPYSAPGSA